MSAWTFDDIPSQSGRTAIVTGANTGIGFETARMLARKGARVTLACRSLDKGREAVNRILAESADAAVSLEQLDLSDLPNIEAFASRFKEQHDRLDLLILNAGVSGIALDKYTGKKVWVSGPGSGGYAAPVLFDIRGNRYAAFFGERALYGVELTTGKGAWFFPWRTSYDVNAADPLIAGDGIFISSNYNSGCAMLQIKDGKADLLWKNNKFDSHFSSFIYIDGYIYGNDGTAWSDKGTFRCLAADTGKEMWAADLGFGSLIAVDNNLIMLNSKGDLIIAEATPDAYMEIARAKGIIARKCWTPPAFSNGRIFIRNDRGAIMCIDVST